MPSEEQTLDQVVHELEIQIKNTDGLHMRPAMQFVDVASKFESEIVVSNDQTSVDGKSIMQMSMLAATCGTKLKVRADGPDAKEAIDAIRRLVEVEMFDKNRPENKK